jgi:DNA-directed RNA polymerase II subunit RPB11
VPEVLIRVTTDGTKTPREALLKVCRDLVQTLALLNAKWEMEIALRHSADNAAQAAAFEAAA